MTQTEIRTQVRYRLRESAASVWADAEINSEINIAQRYIAGLLAPKYLQELVQPDSDSFVAGTDNYALATDFLKMASDVDIAGVTYTLKTPPEIIRQKGYQSANNPLNDLHLAYVADSKLYIFAVDEPTAGQSITWFYVKEPAELGETGESDISDAMCDILVNATAGNCFLKTDIEKAMALKSMVDKQIKELNQL